MILAGIIISGIFLFILVHFDRTAKIVWKAFGFDHIEYFNSVKLWKWAISAIILVLITIILGPNAAPTFIYFQF